MRNNRKKKLKMKFLENLIFLNNRFKMVQKAELFMFADLYLENWMFSKKQNCFFHEKFMLIIILLFEEMLLIYLSICCYRFTWKNLVTWGIIWIFLIVLLSRTILSWNFKDFEKLKRKPFIEKKGCVCRAPMLER